ncbi:MAG: hypothetical protein LBT85_01600 [Bifidobacteriaceae bacterium]|jgi:diacylglycerol kinase family enzyme|nr:hypothetical protein [Bifidobacteriaceae bacterium]
MYNDFLIAIFSIIGFILLVILSSCIIYWIRRVFIKRAKIQLLLRRMPSQRQRNLKYTFIVNPSKKKAAKMVRYIEDFFEKYNFSRPEFLYTKKLSPGEEQAKIALTQGSDVIVAVGGDGTARAVAQVLCQTDKCFAIIPIGTANIFARNLSLNPKDMYKCLLSVVCGHSKIYDMGFAEVKDKTNFAWKGNLQQAFLAVAGIGFDAAMIASTSEKLKRKIGWLAYFSGSLKQMRNPRIDAKIDILEADQITHNIYSTNLRSLLFGNVSKIPGLTLIPPARPNDGKLDFVAIDTKANILGWGQLFRNIVMQSVGLDRKNTIKISNINHKQGLSARVQTKKPVYLQLDGDIMGQIQEVQITLKPSSLIVLVPDE